MTVGKISSVYQLSDSYQTAVTAMKHFTAQAEGYIFFDDLGLELIFSGLNPLEKAEFLTKTLSNLDENERHLLTAYFENDMSLSGTSRQLFIHKNTLQYKLNHIFKKSGLNPRAFRDAVMLYLGLNLAK